YRNTGPVFRLFWDPGWAGWGLRVGIFYGLGLSLGVGAYYLFTELPWADTTDNNEEFTKWKSDMYISETPWTKLGNTALSLARQILNVDPSKRLTLAQIEKHPWMKFRFSNGYHFHGRFYEESACF
ncbi:hypothetical protein NQ317_008083, partial [Molorchus minor]